MKKKKKKQGSCPNATRSPLNRVVCCVLCLVSCVLCAVLCAVCRMSCIACHTTFAHNRPCPALQSVSWGYGTALVIQEGGLRRMGSGGKVP